MKPLWIKIKKQQFRVQIDPLPQDPELHEVWNSCYENSILSFLNAQFCHCEKLILKSLPDGCKFFALIFESFEILRGCKSLLGIQFQGESAVAENIKAFDFKQSTETLHPIRREIPIIHSQMLALAASDIPILVELPDGYQCFTARDGTRELAVIETDEIRARHLRSVLDQPCIELDVKSFSVSRFPSGSTSRKRETIEQQVKDTPRTAFLTPPLAVANKFCHANRRLATVTRHTTAALKMAPHTVTRFSTRENHFNALLAARLNSVAGANDLPFLFACHSPVSLSGTGQGQCVEPDIIGYIKIQLQRISISLPCLVIEGKMDSSSSMEMSLQSDMLAAVLLQQECVKAIGMAWSKTLHRALALGFPISVVGVGVVYSDDVSNGQALENVTKVMAGAFLGDDSNKCVFGAFDSPLYPDALQTIISLMKGLRRGFMLQIQNPSGIQRSFKRVLPCPAIGYRLATTQPPMPPQEVPVNVVWVVKDEGPGLVPRAKPLVAKMYRAGTSRRINHALHVKLARLGIAPSFNGFAEGFDGELPTVTLSEHIPRVQFDYRHAQGLLHAIGIMHSNGIIHGDLHFGNIIPKGDGSVKLIDFDYSCDLARDTPVSGETLVMSIFPRSLVSCFGGRCGMGSDLQATVAMCSKLSGNAEFLPAVVNRLEAISALPSGFQRRDEKVDLSALSKTLYDLADQQIISFWEGFNFKEFGSDEPLLVKLINTKTKIVVTGSPDRPDRPDVVLSDKSESGSNRDREGFTIASSYPPQKRKAEDETAVEHQSKRTCRVTSMTSTRELGTTIAPEGQVEDQVDDTQYTVDKF
eukprot:gnl/Dysnectes_brevis/6264_a9604_322.p1 GENE.gnl/Dysnectes_brevis/6264_a9604_322~~gnl/Dysnectes_brevis/6264_a9604_322.p1  ORF type:complete len:833 (+),score=70.94 gnl/Dysnectes_brevis/6264_a9604_322:62-2500(+)